MFYTHMRLREYAVKNGITYQTAYQHWKKGIAKGRKLATGTIIIDDITLTDEPICKRAILYARVSSSENKTNLESQSARLRQYATAKGYEITAEVKEIGSGVNDKRKKLLALLKRDDYNIIVVEHKDRFSRFGTAIIEELLHQTGKDIEYINQVDDAKADIVQDLVSIITSFTARIYGLRRSKRRTEKIIAELNTES